MSEVETRVVAGREIHFTRADVEQALEGVLPEPLHEHFVVIADRRFPPKQVLAALTGIHRADFTSHQARRVLRGAGFVVGRVSATSSSPPDPQRAAWPYEGREADALMPFRGRWVAQRGLDVLVAADDPADVMAWLSRHDEHDATIFRVPQHASDTETAGYR